eukprot:3692610-Pleurochrysis_carterae.AAC.2
MHTRGQGATAGINVGDYVLLWHASADFAQTRREHGYPALRSFRVVRVLPAAGEVQINPAGTETQPAVSMMRLCKKAPQDWWVLDEGSSAAGRFDLPAGGPSVTATCGGEHDRQVDDEDNVYIVEQIDTAQNRKGLWEYRVV